MELSDMYVPLSHSSFSIAVLKFRIPQIAIDAANPEGWKVLTRVVLTTTTGAVQLWHQDQVQWTREESLASINVAEFVELPEKKITSSHVGDGQETFFARLKRQLSDAQVNTLVRFSSRNTTIYLLTGFPGICRQFR
jgi:hypothetical protein